MFYLICAKSIILYFLFVFSLVLLCQEFCSSRTFILIFCIRKAVIHIVENLFVVEVMINPQVCFCLSAKNMKFVVC